METVQIIAVVLLSLISLYLFWDMLERRKKYHQWKKYVDVPIKVGDTVAHKSKTDKIWVVLGIGDSKINCSTLHNDCGMTYREFSLIELYKV